MVSKEGKKWKKSMGGWKGGRVGERKDERAEMVRYSYANGGRKRGDGIDCYNNRKWWRKR